MISNGKDQCIKLWDLRQMSAASCRIPNPNHTRYDYRYSDFGSRAAPGIHSFIRSFFPSLPLLSLSLSLFYFLSVSYSFSLPLCFFICHISSFFLSWLLILIVIIGVQTHPNDKSIQTYRGHRVYQTLIRAYFSPASTTGQKCIIINDYYYNHYHYHY